MKILVSYRGIPQSPGWATGDMVVKALRALGHFVVPYAKNYQSEEWVEQRDESWTRENKFQEISRQDWDLHLYMEMNDGEQQYTELRDIRARKTACWLFDTSYYPDHLTGLNDFFRFDRQFIANPLDVHRFPRASYSPYACDPELHGRSLDVPKTRDVALVGSIRKDRTDLAKELGRHGIILELIGDVFRDDYIDALASSRIVINQNPEEGRGLLNMRFWEAQAAGSSLLSEWGDIRPNLDVGMEPTLAYAYNDVMDLVDLCKRDQGNTKHIQDKVFNHHTYKHRCEQILRYMFNENY